MMYYRFLGFLSTLFLLPLLLEAQAASINGTSNTTSSFYENYFVTWGSDHIESSNNGHDVQLSLDRYSGSGFASKMKYRTGFFNMTMKLPKRDCAGVVTAFYLTSNNDDDMHDELDFEFLGNREEKPIVLQTNVFANGLGSREERITLWFDPTTDYHNYRILWNEYQVVFYVDQIPIRIFRKTWGVAYPTKPMRIESSIFNGDDWATDGGLTKINWTNSPFVAYFNGFDITGCEDRPDQSCNSPAHWWNKQQYRRLNYQQQRELENVRKNYRIYDYCSDKFSHPVTPRECSNR